MKTTTLSGEPTELHAMNNCHIIGEAFLKRIAQKNHIYKLLHDPTVVGNSALKEIKAGNVTRLPWDMTKVVPIKKRGTSIDQCTWRFACHYHDNQVFKDIDRPDTDINSRTAQFLLAFRAIAAATSWAESYLHFTDKVFLRRARTKKMLRNNPDAQSAIPQLKQHVGLLAIGVSKLAEELSRWQDLYSAHSRGHFPIMSCRRMARPTIRSAGAGVPAWSGRSASVATILPSQQNVGVDGRCDIVVTCVRPKFWLSRLYLRWRINETARRIERLLGGDPVTNIPILATELAFFYAAPDDFDDDSIIDKQQRQAIHARVTSEGLSTLRLQPNAAVLATSKNGTLLDPRDKGSDGGLVSFLRALLCSFRRSIV